MLEDYQYDIDFCVRCSMCKWVNPWDLKSARFSKICPSHAKYLFDTFSAQGRMDLAKGLLDPNRKELLVKSPRLLEAIYACTQCGACDIMCKRSQDLEILETLRELRKFVVREEIGPLPKHVEFSRSTVKNYNPYNEVHKKRLDWLDKGKTLPEKAKIIYFVGCTTSYRMEEIAKSTISILEKANVDFGIMGPGEWCCGSPLLRTGQDTLAKDLIDHNIKTIKDAEAEFVITSCAGCYSTIKVDYPAFAKLDFKIKHSIEFIEDLIKANKLEFAPKKLDIKVTYHDPCHLGRLSEPPVHWKGTRDVFGRLDPPKEFRRGTYGIYEAPRNVITSIPGVKLVEMERIKEYSWCCGAGGGVRAAFPEFSLWASSERIEEAKITGADALVTCCPFCKRNLEDAVKDKGEKLAVYDLTELVLKALK
ncbi:MAG: hypothetical protein HWN66_02110 [Candidatus Helarchaeota archaeon]|nr:hypothetical protein [Candidatus Helarchaeota archaeon]